MTVASLALGKRSASFALESNVPGVRYSPTVQQGRMRLSTEAVGSFTLTLSNLVIGSAIHVATAAGALIENRTAASGTEVFTVPAYAPGNANNSLRIKVRKGSGAPFYIPYETLVTAFIGASSVYVSQIPD